MSSRVFTGGKSRKLRDVRNPLGANIAAKVAIGLCDEDDHSWAGYDPVWCVECKLAAVTLADLGHDLPKEDVIAFDRARENGDLKVPNRPAALVRKRVVHGDVCDQDDHRWIRDDESRECECLDCGLSMSTLRSIGQYAGKSKTYVGETEADR